MASVYAHEQQMRRSSSSVRGLHNHQRHGQAVDADILRRPANARRGKIVSLNLPQSSYKGEAACSDGRINLHQISTKVKCVC